MNGDEVGVRMNLIFELWGGLISTNLSASTGQLINYSDKVIEKLCGCQVDYVFC